jgi:hypothetical protein
MKTSRFRRLTLFLVWISVLLGTVACEDRAALMEIAGMFLPEVLAHKFTGTSGDAMIDAVLGAKAQLDRIGEADALMEQGRHSGDPEKMEEAIALRPHDWRYRVEAATLNLAQNDLKAAERHITEAENNVPDNPQAQTDHALQTIEQLEELKVRLDAQGYQSVEQCNMVHDQLVRNYNRHWSLTGNAGLSPGGQQIAEDQAWCVGRVIQ